MDKNRRISSLLASFEIAGMPLDDEGKKRVSRILNGESSAEEELTILEDKYKKKEKNA